MVLMTGNWKMWLAGTGVSLVIFLIVYFTVIQPSTNTANQAVKTGLQETQQALNQAKTQIQNANSQAGASGSQASTTAAKAQQAISNTSKLAACLSTAGTDLTQVQSCQAKYK